MSGVASFARAVPGRYMWAVDFDGTVVEDRWPEMGDWLPGAAAGLHCLTRFGPVAINTLRIAPVNVDGSPRDPSEVAREVTRIRRMLNKRSLGKVDIWTRPFKVPAQFYIDDRNFPDPFDGDWKKLTRLVEEKFGTRT